MTEEMRSEPGRRLWLGCLVFLAAALPLLDVALFGFRRMFRWLAADSFYYLTIAANFPGRWFFTYDQTYPTNGFHPLWQVVLSLVSVPLSALEQPRSALIIAAWMLSWLAFAGGVLAVALAYERVFARSRWLLLILPTGFLTLAGGWIHLRYATLWNSINGMESALAILFFGLGALFWLREKPRPVAAGLCFGLMVLSRLDTAFFLPGLAVVLAGRLALDLKRRELTRGKILPVGLLLAAAGLPVLFYIILNQIFFGSFMPVSGSGKSTFPMLDPSKADVFRRLWEDGLSAVTKPERWRVFFLFAPVVMAFVWLAVRLIRRDRALLLTDPAHQVLGAGFVMIMIGQGQMLLYTVLWGIGHWYVPVSQVIATLMLIDLLAPLVRVSGRVAAATVLSLTVLQSVFFVFVFMVPGILLDRIGHNTEENRDLYYRIFAHRQLVHAHYNGAIPPLVELDDGIIAYTLGSKVLSGTALAADEEAAERFRQGELLDLALERGYRHVGVGFYGSDPRLYHPAADEETASEVMQNVPVLMPMASYRWKTEWAGEWPSFVILRFEPAQDPAR